MDDDPERAPGVLARRLAANTRRYLAETAELAATHPVPFFGGLTIELAAQSAILLGEFVVHGDDVARSIGRPWPIEAAHARLIMAGVTAVLPRYVDRAAAAGLNATYQVRLRGGPSFQVRFDRGTATVGRQTGAADCRLTVDPVTFLLVAYWRRSQWPGSSGASCAPGPPTLARPAVPGPVRAALTSHPPPMPGRQPCPRRSSAPTSTCRAPARMVDRWTWASTAGPVEHVKTGCERGHWFTHGELARPATGAGGEPSPMPVLVD